MLQIEKEIKSSLFYFLLLCILDAGSFNLYAFLFFACKICLLEELNSNFQVYNLILPEDNLHNERTRRLSLVLPCHATTRQL